MTTLATEPRPLASTETRFPSPPPAVQRVVSLDAYRGLTMLLMISGAMRLPQFAETMAARHPAHAAFWQRVAFHVEHAPWVGASLWDMIQPSFMFMVGVAAAYSVASRTAKGQSFNRQFLHALWRSFLLVALAVFISSNWSKQTNFVFTNVLAQIGLGYTFLFLLAWVRPRWQALTAALILIGYWALFAAHRPADPPTPAGAPPDWITHLPGFASHWDKNANVAAAFDRWFLNLFPHEKPFEYSEGGYATLNFIPSLATMLFGLLAGHWLRPRASDAPKVLLLLAAGVLAIAAGWALGALNLCPIIKRIWTPSWTLYAGGWTCLTLALFYLVCDVARLRAWTLPLTVIGMNSIAVYVLYQLAHSWTVKAVATNFGWTPGLREADPFARNLQNAIFVAVLWLICAWMYRRKLFLRI